jgi:hypothetical protein
MKHQKYLLQSILFFIPVIIFFVGVLYFKKDTFENLASFTILFFSMVLLYFWCFIFTCRGLYIALRQKDTKAFLINVVFFVPTLFLIIRILF